MTLLTIAVVILGLAIAYLLASLPQRVARVLEAHETKKVRSRELEVLLRELSEHTEQTRTILERAAARPSLAFEPEEVNALQHTKIFCEASLPGLAKAAPLLDRYFNNHLAVVKYALGESEPEAEQGVRISNALEEIYRFFAAQRSNDPIAVMERRLATGYSI